MNKSIYSKLAVTNIKNNRKTYIPYILTAVLTVMMYYIMDALARNKSVGDGSLRACLNYALGVIIVFAVIFLFYTNSFLIKRRKKEIGVYNILGMGKRHIAKMLTIESLITAVTSIAAGLVTGIVFSRLMYLILLKLLHYNVEMTFEISPISIVRTIALFAAIFALTLLYNLMQIHLANPVELLRGGSQGEKEPKTKILLTVFGVITIGIGYYIAITTESPLEALMLFFVAVICVILGTYALFTAGSIALLKALRKKKSFYYKTKNFTSVSGMIYRMKQNAVGLANICILSTMVLVMISSTVSLYAGMDDIMNTRFPEQFKVTNYAANAEGMEKIDRIIKEETEKAGVTIKDEISYRSGEMSAILEGGKVRLEESGNYDVIDVVELSVIPLEDYNKYEKADVSLKDDEVLLYMTGKMYGKDSIQLGSRRYKVARELKDMTLEKKNKSNVMEHLFIVVPSLKQVEDITNEAYGDSEMEDTWTQKMGNVRYTVRIDFEENGKKELSAMEAMGDRIVSEAAPSFCESREMSIESFYMLYGGLLFIGIYLGLMFLMATVLIIYYKQISEGFDDKERYQIMQKVGMSKKEVKRSIRSQVLTVFFLPLAAAIIHIAVAFKVITRMLEALNFVNVSLFLTCTITTVVVFAIFYAIVFAITAREYYKIVN
ncbi:ABC transporter permease [Dorea sp. D27]|uniref:ABC transporter permease n=1 Tax=Dorea sp. D27 TaxID=658665 RepID=UPI0006732E3B|nr:ABC transporter permease [Dorea sp. D27]KMZ53209.1 putative ABC transporter, permease protein [Dorea sp. D27]